MQQAEAGGGTGDPIRTRCAILSSASTGFSDPRPREAGLS